MKAEIKDGIKTTSAKSPREWRNWLQKNGEKEKRVWLIIYTKGSGVASVTYNEAVDEALCFGWIDSKPNKRDDKSYYQFFARRNPKSNWSKMNKEKVAQLAKEGRIHRTGLAAIAQARENGTWIALDGVENLEIPEDLQMQFSKDRKAEVFFNAFPRSAKRGILEWILSAKTKETRDKRIEQTVRLAKENIRANQYRPKL